MIEQVNNAGMTRFGSGWAWVVMDKDGKLSVMSTANQDNPLSEASSRSSPLTLGARLLPSLPEPPS